MAAAAAGAMASSVFGSQIAAGNANCGMKTKARRVGVRSVRCEAVEKKDEEVIQRRALVKGVGFGILSLVASGAANALPPVPEGEPKPGTKDAIKKYANICRSMPTASVCHG